LINGPVLGVFLVGTFLKRVRENAALTGMILALLLMLYIRFFTPIAWTWYALIGSLSTLVLAWAASFIFAEKSEEKASI
jgi:solute:Na+ symporter, SSS family